MKVIGKKILEITYLAPESAEEDQTIQRTIREVESETVPADQWQIVDNRQSPGRGEIITARQESSMAGRQSDSVIIDTNLLYGLAGFHTSHDRNLITARLVGKKVLTSELSLLEVLLSKSFADCENILQVRKQAKINIISYFKNELPVRSQIQAALASQAAFDANQSALRQRQASVTGERLYNYRLYTMWMVHTILHSARASEDLLKRLVAKIAAEAAKETSILEAESLMFRLYTSPVSPGSESSQLEQYLFRWVDEVFGKASDINDPEIQAIITGLREKGQGQANTRVLPGSAVRLFQDALAKFREGMREPGDYPEIFTDEDVTAYGRLLEILLTERKRLRRNDLIDIELLRYVSDYEFFTFDENLIQLIDAVQPGYADRMRAEERACRSS